MIAMASGGLAQWQCSGFVIRLRPSRRASKRPKTSLNELSRAAHERPSSAILARNQLPYIDEVRFSYFADVQPLDLATIAGDSTAGTAYPDDELSGPLRAEADRQIAASSHGRASIPEGYV
jgi:hypothetical protein